MGIPEREAIMSENSIFSLIRSAILPDGSLPSHFDLPDSEEEAGGASAVTGATEDNPRKVRFAPGAKDGISIYHFGVTPVPDVAKEVTRIIRKDCKKSGTAPNPRLREIFREYSALSLIDDLLDDLARDMRGIILSNFADYAALGDCQIHHDSGVRPADPSLWLPGENLSLRGAGLWHRADGDAGYRRRG